MAINVNRNVEDTFYRYKMPRLLAKVEGKGNGIKTVIANMVDIGKALNRPPTYPTKYFGCELGAQTQFDLKNERYIVNGDHDAVKLQDLLDGFIRKFVLCQECDNPETTIIVKGQKIALSCKACGHMTPVDPRHRLTTFVVKNPPADSPTGTTAVASSPVEQDSVGAVTASNGGKRGKSAKARGGKETNGHGAHSTVTTDDGSGDQDGVKDNNSDDAAGGGEDDWAVDPEDADDRQRELVGNMANITMNDDLEKSVDERLKIFMEFLKDKMKNNAQLDPKAVQVEAERLDVKEEALLVICRALYDDRPLLLADDKTLSANRPLFLRFAARNERAQRHLLGALEQILTGDKKSRDLLLPKVPRILEMFYDADVLEEKQILKWGDKTSSKYVTREENKEVRARAAPFLKWLKEAEEESDGEDGEEDDGIEIVYDNKPQKPVSHQNGDTHAVNKDDDFDIDNI